MSIIRVTEHHKWDCKTEAEKQSATVEEWMMAFCPVTRCSICDNNIWEDDFIFWRGAKDIALCSECAEHTLNGLNRDLLELRGDREVWRKPGEVASAVLLKAENARLRQRLLEEVKKRIELQELLAKQNER